MKNSYPLDASKILVKKTNF